MVKQTKEKSCSRMEHNAHLRFINDQSVPKIKVLSLFSGCGGMDLGFEGGFSCLRKSVNTKLHPD